MSWVEIFRLTKIGSWWGDLDFPFFSWRPDSSYANTAEVSWQISTLYSQCRSRASNPVTVIRVSKSSSFTPINPNQYFDCIASRRFHPRNEHRVLDPSQCCLCNWSTNGGVQLVSRLFMADNVMQHMSPSFGMEISGNKRVRCAKIIFWSIRVLCSDREGRENGTSLRWFCVHYGGIELRST